MRVLFLDIDGVLNTTHTFRRHKAATGQITGYICEPELVQRLNRVIRETGCRVVISSSWRLGHTKDELQAILESFGFEGQIHDFTERFGDRGDEIWSWIEENHATGDWAVVDDDTHGMKKVAWRQVVTNMATHGLTPACADRLIELLTEDHP